MVESDIAVTVRGEMTPNPQTYRFVINRVLTEKPADFKNAKETATAPLARKLFGFPWTSGVFIGRDFVTVTKQEWVDWDTLAEPLASLIQEHIESGDVAIHQGAAENASSISAGDSADVQTIKRILDQEIRPAVAQDGGDILFHKFEDGVVHLFMQGSCAGCPSSTMTLKMGIETRLKEAVPSVREVVSV
jgi:Fe-S cluster biogenesis protein NfuA